MKKYWKEFLRRGAIFGGFGPIIAGIVYMIIDFCGVELNLAGWQIFVAILTTYVLAFVQAGSSVFEQIEEWSTVKSAFVHLLAIYLVYLATYLVNSWLPFSWIAVVVFTVLFVVTFAVIWLVVYSIARKTSKQLNKRIS